MAFTYDPDTKAGYVRLLIGDTNESEPAKQIFTDKEINSFLSRENNSVYNAAAAAAEAIAASQARSAIAWETLGRSVDKSNIPQHYRKAADRWRDKATGGQPAEEIDSMAYGTTDTGRDRSEFVGESVLG